MNQHELNPEPHDFADDELAAMEQELRRALRPVDPPAGFAGRVIARSQRQKPARIAMFPVPHPNRWAGAALAAMLLVGAGGEQFHQLQQRRKAEQAQKQFETAMEVTDRALEHAREQLQHAGLARGN